MSFSNHTAGTAAANGQQAPSASGGLRRVMVVEDNTDTRTLLLHLLRNKCDLVLVGDGEEALDKARQQQFDLILLDINLGRGLSGENVMQELRKMPAYEKTPIIAVTAYAMPGDKEHFLESGFNDYVAKPFTRTRLVEVLEADY